MISADMTPLKPYLVRAVYDWIVDNRFTPYLLVNAEVPGTVVPMSFVENGQIVLNLRPEAINALDLGEDGVRFNARFAGQPMRVDIPNAAILALYAQENGRGMVFDNEDEGEDKPQPEPPQPEPPKKPVLRVVK
jgi:stringent starvation protein B